MLITKEELGFIEKDKYDDVIGLDIGCITREDLFDITYNPRNKNNRCLSGDIRQSVSLNENERNELRKFIIKILKEHNFKDDLELALISGQIKLEE